MPVAPASSSDLTERFDQLRAMFPDCALSLYAYVAGGPVTFEIITPDEDSAPYTFVGRTAAEAMALAVPAPAETPASIFD